MITKYVKIKPVITLADEKKAIDFIVDYMFEGGEYTPWNKEAALITAIAVYFIDGVEFEKDDVIYDCVMQDQNLHAHVNKFFYNVDKSDKKNDINFTYINTKNHVMESVQKIVDFKLQKMIHCTDEKHEMYTEIAEMANAVANIGRNVQVAAKPVLENPESIGMIMNILKKMNEIVMCGLDVNSPEFHPVTFPLPCIHTCAVCPAAATIFE